MISEAPIRSSRNDWDGAPSVSLLLGREDTAETLKRWILDEFCRVVLITGFGGVGKTDLVTCLGRGGNRSISTSNTLATGIQSHFDCVMWRSLLNAPPPDELFADMLNFLSEHHHVTRRASSKQLEDILGYLQSRRCLVILDNIETVLQPGDPTMGYRNDYERYGTFFELVAKATHQSCLLLTSREKPRAIAELEGARKPVRSLALTGIGALESQSLFAQISTFSGNDAHWRQIVNLYHGNPLALELAARHIDQVFGGDLASFLGMGRPVFADLEELLDWHLDRLTKEETELIYWLAIEREPVTSATLRDNFISPVSRQNIASTLQSLQRRIPLERIALKRTDDLRFTLQPVLIEHVTARLVDRVTSAFTKAMSELARPGVRVDSESDAFGALQLCNAYSLVKATAKESIRDSQQRLILGPIAERLSVRDLRELTMSLMSLISVWRRDGPRQPGYMAGNIINLLLCLHADLHGTDFSNLSIWQACLHDANLHEINFSLAAFRHTTFRHPFGTVFSICHSPDGQLLAVGDDNGEVRVFFVANGQLHVRCIGHSDVVWGVTFSQDGQTIASASFDNTIRLWSAKSGQCIDVLIGHEGWVYSTAFSPDGGLLASASEDGTCRLWNLRTGHHTTLTTNDRGFVAAVAFSPNGELLAAAGSGCAVSLFRIFDLEHPTLFTKQSARIRSLAFSSEGDKLASGAEDGQISLWQPTDGRHLATLSGHSGSVTSLSFSGGVLASASDDHTVRLWSTVGNECVGQIQVASARVWAVNCNPAGRTFATGSEDAAVRVWDMDTYQCLTTLRGYSNRIWSLASSPDSSLILAGSEDSLVRAWDIRDAQVMLELRGHASRVWSVACSSDGRWVASASDDLTVRIWDMRSGACVHVMRGHTDWIRSVAFDHDSRLVASAGEDGKIFIWDVVRGVCVTAVEGAMSRVLSVTFCKDASCLAAGGAAHEIILFRPSDGNQIGKLHGHQGWLSTVVSLDAMTLASCSEDGTARIWDMARLECTATLAVGSKVWCGAFCDGGGSFLTGSDDGILRRWAVRSGLREAEITAHQGSLRTLVVNADGSTVATAGDDGSIRLWELSGLTPCASPNMLRPARPYEGTNITGATGLTSAQREALVALGAIALPATLKQFTPVNAPIASSAAAAPLAPISSSTLPTRASVRKLLDAVLRSDADFEAFCFDYFERTQARFSGGMERLEKTTLLLKHEDPDSILARLREHDAAAVARHEGLLKYE